MRRYKTECYICGKETRSHGIGERSIDECYVCFKERQKKQLKYINKHYNKQFYIGQEVRTFKGVGKITKGTHHVYVDIKGNEFIFHPMDICPIN